MDEERKKKTLNSIRNITENRTFRAAAKCTKIIYF